NERHESFYYLNIVAGLERLIVHSLPISDAKPDSHLTVSAQRKEDVRRLLVENGAAMNKPIAVLCPGSVNSRAKRWPAERFAELSDRLSESGNTVVIIGSPAEADVSEEVRGRVRHQPVMLTGQTTVAQMVALISIA